MTTTTPAKKWNARNVIMLEHEALAHITDHRQRDETVYQKASWLSIPYILPDGTRGGWWQPWQPIRYKALDLTYSRARDRLARVNRPATDPL